MRIFSKTSLCSSIAIATALIVGASPATAQVVGTLNNAGGATVTGGGASVVLNNPQTTIDWTATGAPVSGVRDFLPTGNTMAFSGASDFAVLNRVSSGTDMIGLNGTITSTVNSVAGRGTVFFYNPNGIVVGGSAMIDVGSLGLTTAPVNGAGTPNWFPGFNAASPTLTFNQAAAGSQIRIEAGAGAIKSNGTNSFIAMVAPKITTSGTIKTDGDIALVAAEAATLSFSDQYDLYSIEVSIGTSVSDSLTVSDGSIGRNSPVETAGIARNAYLVAVPKNDATTLLITGGANLGFDVANSAVVEGNSIILSAGRDTAFIGGEAPGGTVKIESATFSSFVDAYATDAIRIGLDGGGSHFSDLTQLTAVNAIEIDAIGADVAFDDQLLADVSAYGGPGQDITAGSISLLAQGGHTLSVAGGTVLTADAEGGVQFASGMDGTSGTGGNVTIKASGGSISLANLTVSAEGTGGNADSEAAGGTGTGGTVELLAEGGGSLGAGNVWLHAGGTGGSISSDCFSCGISGGTGQGGTVTVSAGDADTSMSFGQFLASANGTGGSGDLGGGAGIGGTMTLALDGLVDVDLGSFGDFYAEGEGGYGIDDGAGGSGLGGYVFLTMTEADADRPTLATASLLMSANGAGGYSGNGRAGGDGTGNGVFATIDGGDLLVGAASFRADGRGGYSWNDRVGESHGGDVSLALTDAAVVIDGTMTLSANGLQPFSEGDPAIGNLSTGGTATLTATNSNIVVNAGNVSPTNSLVVSAYGEGATGGSGDGGSAIGGVVTATLSGTTLLGGEMLFDAHALGGEGLDGLGGDADGGQVDVSLTNSTVNAGPVTLNGSATGGAGTDGGGGATGRSINLTTAQSALYVSGILSLNGRALGGAGTFEESGGGSAQASDIHALFDDSTVTTTGRIDISSEGTGGGANGTYNGGDGIGGAAELIASGGSVVSTNNTKVIAYGTGGSANCSGCDARGGSGTGGAASLTLSDSGTTFGVNNTLEIYSSGIGGNGTGDASGGEGYASSATARIGGGSTLNVKNAFVFADGVGGSAEGYGNGGAAHASTASLLGDTVAGGTINYSSAPSPFHVTAEGFGGAAVDGNGGDAFGGTATVDANGLHFDSANQGLRVSAYGMAGDSVTGGGGYASGGSAVVNLHNGAQFSMARDLVLNSYALGGDGTSGGDAHSGSSNLTVDGASLVTGTAYTPNIDSITLAAYATGGNGSDGDGGNATSSNANLLVSNGGTVTAKSIHVWTDAQGGTSDGGVSGGDADAGYSLVQADSGGSLSVAGMAKISAGAIGGAGTNGANGGDALADSLALLDVFSGGTVAITGDLQIATDRTGGAGHDGGDALAVIDYQTPTVGELFPVSEILSQGGTVTVGGVTTMTSNAIGGAGDAGGNGGDAFGGVVSLRAPNSAFAPSVITVHDTVLSATATAGDGGQGDSPELGNGGDGGKGGDALGGMLFIQAMSLDGQITTGDLTLTTTAHSGSGGDGGYGINGGNGGAGGTVATNWSAGAINISSPSGGNPAGLPQVTNGFVHLGNIIADTSATGGTGGWGGYAYDGVNGAAGNGGYAQSGDLYVINRGGDLSAGDVTWNFDATGGEAGRNPNESLAAVGGSASTGGLLLSNTNRFNQPAERGTMTFGNFSGTGTSTGGAGLVDGSSLHTSAINFETTNSDAHFSSLTFAAIATDGPAVGDYDFTSTIAVANGTVLFDNDMSITVPGDLAVWLESATLTANTIDLSAADFVHRAGAAPTVFGLIDAGALSVSTGGDIIIDANLDISGSLNLSAPGSVAIGSAATHDGGLTLSAEGGFVLSNDLDSAGGITLNANGSVTTQALTAGGDIYVSGYGVAIGGAIDADYGVTINSGLGIDAGDIGAGTSIDLLASSGDVSVGVLDAGWAITIDAAGDVSFGSAATENDDIEISAGGAVTTAGNLTSGQDIEIEAAGLVSTGDLSAQGAITVEAGAIDIGDVSAGIDLGLCGGICSLDFPEKDIGLWSMTTLHAGNLSSTGRIGMAAGDDISVGTIDAIGLVMALAGGDFGSGHIQTDGEIYLGGFDMFALGYDVETGDFDSAPVLALAPTATGGSVTIGGAVSGLAVRANAGGTFTSGALTTTDGNAIIAASGNLGVGALAIGGDLGLESSGGNLVMGGGTVSGAVYAEATNGTLSAGAISAGDDIFLSGRNGASAGFATSEVGDVKIFALNGTVNSAGANAGGDIGIASFGATTVTGDLDASGAIGVDAGGNISLQSVDAGDFLEVRSSGNISLTNATAGTDGWLAAAGNVSANSFGAGGIALVLADGTVNVGSIVAGVEANGTVGIGGYDIYAAAYGFEFDPTGAYEMISSADGAGNVSVADIQAQFVTISGANVSLGDVNYADELSLLASGTATVTGGWSVSNLDLSSNDIQIGTNGSIDANFVDLTSTNTIGAGLGDNTGAAQGSYLLTNAEFTRINADHLILNAEMNGSAIDLLIGNLTLVGGENYYDFGVVNSNGGYDGRLRVVGKISGQNFTNDDQLDLDAQLMEIDAVNGGIDFSPNSDATVGTLAFYGQRVHVAEASVLDKLAADTQYADRDLDLSLAPTAAHSETTVNVGQINLILFEPNGQGGLAVPAATPTYSIYVQNMSSSNVRSGLLIAGADILAEIPPGSVEMIINGKLVDPETNTTLSGGDVRDAFVADPETDLTLFTASSSINGCALTGGACFTPEPPPPPPPPKVEDLANQFVFLDTSVGDQLGFGDDADNGGDDGSDEDEGDKKAEKNAIDPPPQVINGKPIDPQTPTDEPVSGSGNPALIGTGNSQQEQQ